MLNRQQLEGNWHEVKGKLRSKWGSLTDDDLKAFNGDVEHLVGTIQRKTGEARESIEQFLERSTADNGAPTGYMGEKVRNYAHESTDAGHQTSSAAVTTRDSYEAVEAVIQERPAESLVVCFGAGLICGLMVGILLK